MTEKEKIREEVVGIINSINLFAPDEDGKNSSYEEGRLVVASQILQIIDSMQEEPVSNPINFEQELYKAFGQVKDFTLGMRIAKWFYDMGKNSQEPVSENLDKEVFVDTEEIINEIDPEHKVCSPLSDMDKAALEHFRQVMEYEFKTGLKMANMTSFKAGANWQKEQDKETIELAEDHAMLAGMKKMEQLIMAKAVEVTVHIDAGGYPYISQIELYDYDKDVPLANKGDKYKVVLIKENKDE